MTHYHQFLPGQLPSTLILLHGTGGNEHQMIDWARQLNFTGHLLAIRGNSTEEGFNRYFARLSEGVYNHQDLQLKTEQLADFITQAATTYHFKLSHSMLLGYSNGANMALSLQLHQPAVFQRSILLRALYPGISRHIPAKDLSTLTATLIQGNNDPLISAHQTQELVAFLQRNQATINVAEIEATHQLAAADLALINQTLATSDSA